MELWLASGLAALSPHSLHQFIHSFFGFPRTAKKRRVELFALLPRFAWGGVSFTLIPFIHFIFIDSIKTKMKFIRHFVHSTHNLCFQLHFFASLAARLLCGLVAVRLLPPLTPPKRAHWPRNQTNTAVGAHSLIKNGSLSLFASLFISFSIRKGPQGKEKII